MQKALDVSHPGKVQIVTVNYAGHESGVPAATAGRTLPVLQDTATDDVVGSWQPTYRDVVIVDQKNVPVAIYNLTTNDLGVPANYAALEASLLQFVTP